MSDDWYRAKLRLRAAPERSEWCWVHGTANFTQAFLTACDIKELCEVEVSDLSKRVAKSSKEALVSI